MVWNTGDLIAWFSIMIPCCLLLTGIGIRGFIAKKPVNFWAGVEVNEEEISDVKAYNKANAYLWIIFSLPIWASCILTPFIPWLGITLSILSCSAGIAFLIIGYKKIYAKYKAGDKNDIQADVD